MVTVNLEEHILTLQELAAVICRAKGVHEGLWHVLVNFAPQATLMPFAGADAQDEWYPAVVVPVPSIGIMRVTQPNPMTVDAARVNPRGGS